MRRAGIALALTGLAAAPLLAQADPKTATEHVVKPGETLGGIANRAAVPRVLIIEANGLKEPYLVRAGQKLVIPTLAKARPSAPAAAPVAASTPAPVGTKSIAAASPKQAPDPGPAPGAPETTSQPPAKFAWPVKGDIARAFAIRGGDKPFHDGIDIKVDRGTAARAAAAGTVIFAGQGPKEYGLTVIIHHGGRWTTTYSFLDKITVRDGDKVKASERVGLVGQTGLASEPQLHFEVRRNRVALDPVKYLPKFD